MNKDSFYACSNDRINRQFLFSAEIDKMTSIIRHTLLIDKSRRENDAEHSWHIAVMAMLFSEYAVEPVEVGRVVQMCLVHDLVEIIAGDTFAYDAGGSIGKKEREKAAAEQLFAQLPEDQGEMIRHLWEEFDATETSDAKCAVCMDRIQPFLHNTLTDGHTWVENGVSREAVEKRMKIVKEFMPEIYEWIWANIENAVLRGWLKP